MLFVLPASAHDIPIFEPLVRVIVRFGKMHNHEFLVLPTPEVEAEATRIAQPLHDLCKTRVVATHENHTGSWPWACNKMFVAGVQIVISSYSGPWMWLEADSCPVRDGWADLLETEYRMSQKRCMGFLRYTDEVAQGYEGQHLVGCGIYDTQMWHEQMWWNSLVNCQNEPFDIVLRHWIAPISHHTKLYHHAYTSYDYKRTAAGYSYTASVLNENRQKAREIQGFIAPEVAIVHGCKDTSLAKLILSNDRVVTPAQGENVIKSQGETITITPPEGAEFIFDGLQTNGFSQIADPAKVKEVLPEPSTKQASTPEFKALLHLLQFWQIEIPSYYQGLAPGSASHVKLILDTIEASKKQEAEQQPLTQRDHDNAKAISRIVNAQTKGMKRHLILDELEISLADLYRAAEVPGVEFELSPGPRLYVKPLKPGSVTPRPIQSVEA